MRYHYPQGAYPYERLIEENASRDRSQPEFELLDTGIFDGDRYWKVDVDYAKESPTDISMRIRVTNMGPDADTVHVLPSVWFRNDWDWGSEHVRPIVEYDEGTIVAEHWRAGRYHLEAAPLADGSVPTPVFCDNETNTARLFGERGGAGFALPEGRDQRPCRGRHRHREPRPAGDEGGLVVPADGRRRRDRGASPAVVEAGA